MSLARTNHFAYYTFFEYQMRETLYEKMNMAFQTLFLMIEQFQENFQ